MTDSQKPDDQLEYDPDAENGEHQDGSTSSYDYEAEARLLGWKPENEYEGDPKYWKSAEEFVEHGKSINPILRKNNEKLMAELVARDQKISQLEGSVKHMADMYQKLSKSAYEKAILDIKSQLRQARNEGDYDLADQLEERADALKDELKSISDTPTPAQQSQVNQAEIQQLLQSWQSRNTWYTQDATMTMFADGVAANLSKSAPHLIGKQGFLDEVERQTRQAFPQKFQNPRRQSGSPVASGSSARASGDSGSKGYSWNDLDAQTRQEASELIGNGLPFKDKAEYLKAYEQCYGPKK